MKFDLVLKHFKLNFLTLLFRFVEPREITVVLHQRNLNIGMHLYTNKQIWFKLGMTVMDTTELYILILKLLKVKLSLLVYRHLHIDIFQT